MWSERNVILTCKRKFVGVNRYILSLKLKISTSKTDSDVLAEEECWPEL